MEPVSTHPSIDTADFPIYFMGTMCDPSALIQNTKDKDLKFFAALFQGSDIDHFQELDKYEKVRFNIIM